MNTEKLNPGHQFFPRTSKHLSGDHTNSSSNTTFKLIYAVNGSLVYFTLQKPLKKKYQVTLEAMRKTHHVRSTDQETQYVEIFLQRGPSEVAPRPAEKLIKAVSISYLWEGELEEHIQQFFLINGGLIEEIRANDHVMTQATPHIHLWGVPLYFMNGKRIFRSP